MDEGPDLEEKRFFDEELKEDLRVAGKWSRRYWEFIGGVGCILLLIAQLLTSAYNAQPKIKEHKEPIWYAEKLARVQHIPNYNLSSEKYRGLRDVMERHAGSWSEMKGMIAALYPDALPPLESRPASGVVWQDDRLADGGVLKIDATKTTAFDSLVVLSYYNNRVERRKALQARQIYVRGGEVASVPLPQGTYTLKLFSGTTWFGLKTGFGPLASEVAFDGVLIVGDNERARGNGLGGFDTLLAGEMYDPLTRGTHHGYKLTLVPSRQKGKSGVESVRCVRLKRAEAYTP